MNRQHMDTLIAIYDSLSHEHIKSVSKHEFRSAEEYRKCIELLSTVIVYCSQTMKQTNARPKPSEN